MDATWEMGMNYPFNFIGYLDDRERQILDDLVEDLDDDEVNIFFGHYPTSTVQQSDYLRQLVSHHGHVYLSGHLHDLAVFHEHHLYSFHDQVNKAHHSHELTNDLSVFIIIDQSHDCIH